MDRLMLKQRVVGALVLLSLAVIFLPLLFESGDNTDAQFGDWVPPRPQAEEFGSYEPQPVEWQDDPAQELWSRQDQVEETPEVMPEQPVPDPELPAAPRLDAESIPESWSVQLATFSQVQNAEALSKRLQKAGYQAYTRQIKTVKGPMTRVFVGPELVSTDASKLRDRLNREFKLKGIVVRFQP